MKFAYADPPYLGCAAFYKDHHAEAMVWDDPATHRELIEMLSDVYPDGWALSLHEPSLRTILNMCPEDVRVSAWVKPFASFKPNVRRAWTWEPVIFRGGRPLTREQPTWRDHLSANITLKKGLVGAKPVAFCKWVLEGLNFQRGDSLDDLFPGTGVMGQTAKEVLERPEEFSVGLFRMLPNDATHSAITHHRKPSSAWRGFE